MRNPVLFFGTFFLVYGLAVFYSARRLRQGFPRLRRLSAGVWYGGMAVLSILYFLPRLFERFFPPFIESVFAWSGGMWLAVVYYATLLFFLADVLLLFIVLVSKKKPSWYRRVTTVFVAVTTASLCAYGAYNALSPVVAKYEITLPGKFSPFTLAAVSDIHLGRQVGARRLAQLTDLLNQQEADVIVLLGDTIDDDLEPVKAFDGAAGLRRLSAPWGVFAVMGNHEYLRNRGDEYAAYLKDEAKLRLLRDETIVLPNGAALIGRDDVTRERMGGKKAMPLPELRQGLAPETPIIVLDHNPNRFVEVIATQLPLLLSGHTHVGQLAPNQLALRHMYPVDYGVLTNGVSQLIVSSGFGTWGPPIRVGNHPEIMLFNIKPSE